MGGARRVERVKEAACGMQRRSADQQVGSSPMPQEANQRQDEKVVQELTQMPQTPVDRPLHALIEIQERHPGNGTLEDVPTYPTKNGTYSTASASKKDWQNELTDLPEVPQRRQNGRT